MKQKKTLAAYNGQTRGDGYDAYMRPVRKGDNAPGGCTHRVKYVAVSGGDERVGWFDSESEARNAALYGPAAGVAPN